MTYGWVATTLGVAASIHVALVNENVPFIEYAPPAFYPDAVLRQALAGPEPAVKEGAFEVPTAPGLGVTVDEAALERLRVA